MNSILEKIRSADNLPSLPTVAIEVLRLTRDENVTLAELAEAIQNDPALTGKLLKLVNCSLFGLPKKISSLRQAMVVLGLRTVKVMALSFSLVDSMRNSATDDFDYQGYWRRSLTTAVAAWLLADYTNPPVRDDAFVGGLLADIGMLAALHCVPNEYGPVVKSYQNSQSPPQVVEQQALGACHAQLSQFLLETWGLPDQLCVAVAAHHGDTVQPQPKDVSFSLLLQSAAAIADLFCQNTQADSMDQIVKNVREWTQITESDLDKLLQVLDTKVT